MEISGVVSSQTAGTTDSVYGQSTGSSSNTQQASVPTHTSVPDITAVSKAVQELNKRLADAPTAVVFDTDTTSHRVWLNVIDKTTGKVVSELPPEAVRKLIDSYAVAGLAFDKLR